MLQRIRGKFLMGCSSRGMIRLLKMQEYLYRIFHTLVHCFTGRFRFFLLFVVSSGLVLLAQFFDYFISQRDTLAYNYTYSSATNVAQADYVLTVANHDPVSFISSIFSLDELGLILGVYVVFFILVMMFTARRTMVIEDFVDETKTNRENDQAKGLASLLLVELNWINSLYRDVDEQRVLQSTSGGRQGICAVLKVDDYDELLKTAISADSVIEIGFLKIPVSVFASLFNRIMGGPRLRCSLQKHDDKFMLVASMSGIAHPLGWDIPLPDREKLQEKEPGVTPIENAVHELAGRIFTDVPATGSFRWEATNAFNEGLHKYRNCLRTPKDQIGNLADAEKKFLETLKWDTTFTMAWHNLGIVYLESGKMFAAEEAFTRALQQNPNRWDVHYALALIRYLRFRMKDSPGMERHPDCLRPEKTVYSRDPDSDILYLKDKVIEHCRQVCRIDGGIPGFSSPENFNLMAVTFLEIFRINAGKEPAGTADDGTTAAASADYLERAYKYQKMAVISAWKRYSRLSRYDAGKDFFLDRRRENYYRFLCQCISDLAWIAAYRDTNTGSDCTNMYRESGWILEQGLALTTGKDAPCMCPEMHWRSGAIHYIRSVRCTDDQHRAMREAEQRAAKKAFRTAIRLSPRVMKYPLSLTLFGRVPCSPGAGTGGASAENTMSWGLRMALPFVLTSWKEVDDRTRHQWKEMEEIFWICRSACGRDHPEILEFRNVFCNLWTFSKCLYRIHQFLDAFDPRSQELEISSGRMVYPFEEDIRLCTKALGEIKKIQPGIPLLEEWMQGHIHLVNGRNFYLKADYALWENYVKFRDDPADGDFASAEREFQEACSCFRDIPEESVRMNLYSRLARIGAIHQDNKFPEAFFLSVYAHWCDPFSDFQHSIAALIWSLVHSHDNARSCWAEAMSLGYGMAGFSQYVLSQYLNNCATTTIQAIQESGDAKKKECQCESTMNVLTNALDLLHAAFNRAASPLDGISCACVSSCTWPKASAGTSLDLQVYPDPRMGRLRENQFRIYMQGIFAVRFRMGMIYHNVKNHAEAVAQFRIVLALSRPDDRIPGTSRDRCRFLDTHILAQLALGEIFLDLKQYKEAVDCVNEILRWKNEIEQDIGKKRLYGYDLRIICHPQNILLKAYLLELRSLLDRNSGFPYPVTTGSGQVERRSLSWLCGEISRHIREFSGVSGLGTSHYLAEFFRNNMIQARCGFLKCLGLISLYEKVEKEKVEKGLDPKKIYKDLTGKEVSDFPEDPAERAVLFFEEAVAHLPDPEAYMFLLKALEKQIGKDAAASGTKKSDGTPAKDNPKTDPITQASRYLDVLKTLDTSGGYKDFTDALSKKLKEASGREKSGTGKTTPSVVCCVIPCSTKPGKTDDPKQA